MKKTVMITGASGFIGSNFIKRYGEEYNIVPVCLIENAPEDLDFKGVDTVLHLAALVHQMKGAPEEKYFEVNTELTRRLATKAKEVGVKHFVFYSTVKVYGYDGDLDNHDFVLTEKSPCNPNDPYGASKFEAEKLLRALESEEFKVALIRPPMVYGEGVKGNMLSLIKLVDKLPILPFGYDENRRSIISTENLLYMTHLIIQKSADGIYLGTEGEPVSIKDIATSIEKGLGKSRINIKLPSFVFRALCKIKPNIMVRLFGTLAFKQEDNYSKIDYLLKSSMDIEINKMTRKKDAIIFIAGSGGHKTQMERIIKMLNSQKSNDYEKIGFFEKGYAIEKFEIQESYEFIAFRDKYSYTKTILGLPILIFKQFKICRYLNSKYNIRGVISTGPGIAILPSLIFKFLGKKIIFIETWSKFYRGSMTGKILYKITDKFYIQNKSLQKEYPKGIYGGKL